MRFGGGRSKSSRGPPVDHRWYRPKWDMEVLRIIYNINIYTISSGTLVVSVAGKILREHFRECTGYLELIVGAGGVY
jgi:hypothetical protein